MTFFRLAHVGNDGLEREPDASGHAGEAERRAHDLEESAAGDGVDPFGGAFGEFAVQGVLEFVGAGEFFEAAPVFGTGFFGGVVGGGGVDAFADGGQVQFSSTGQMSSRFLIWIRPPLFFSSFVIRYEFVVPSLRDLFQFVLILPRTYVLGYIAVAPSGLASRLAMLTTGFETPKSICDRCCRS